jgi:hypothetical protein
MTTVSTSSPGVGDSRSTSIRRTPLAWVVPGATRWRVRKVPEVLVWAKTFHRLALGCETSVRQAVPLELRVGFPIAATGPLHESG